MLLIYPVSNWQFVGVRRRLKLIVLNKNKEKIYRFVYCDKEEYKAEVKLKTLTENLV